MEDLDAQFQDADFEDIEEPDSGFDPLLELKPLTFLCDPALSEGEAIEWRLLQQQKQQQTSCDQVVTNCDQVLTNCDQITTNHIMKETSQVLKSSELVKCSDEISEEPMTSVLNEEVTKLVEILDHGESASSELWVDLCEQAASLVIQVLPLKQELCGVVVSWVERGLNIDKAKLQPQPGYKVRHLKSGLRLALALCYCGTDVLTAMLDIQLHQKLCNMIKEEHMALPLRLLSLRTLDSSLRTADSTEMFLKSGGYTTLLDLLQEAKLARLQFALASLIRKIHIFDTLKLVHALTSEITNNPKTILTQTEKLSAAFEEVLNNIKDASLKTGQFRRFLPVKSQFEFPVHVQDPYLAIFSYMKHFCTLQALLVTLTHPTTCDNLITPGLDLLQFLLTCESGLRFLASNTEVTHSLIKVLLITNNELGVKLAYYMRVISALDQLWSNLAKINSETNSLESLRTLYCLGECLLGRLCTAHVLTRGDNIIPIISAISSNRGALPGRSYAMDLLINSIILIDSPEFLSKHGEDLRKLISQEQRLTNLNFWLKNTGGNVEALTEVCKSLVEKAGNLPSELISGLRALKNLALPEQTENSEFVELKQRHSLLELFSHDGATILANILNKVVETFEQPALYTAAFLGPKGTRLTALLSPALSLLRAMLSVVAHCQGANFRNLTSVPALLGSYTLLHAFPKCSPLFPLALHARGEAVTALLAFTQPCSEEALPKSLWTQMLAEVLRHATSAPNTFLPGLELLSELLPLPLPFTAREKLSDEESARITSLHRLWGAHLHPLASAVHEMISLLGAASSPPLVSLVRRVCLQICDLEPSSALMVARAILEPTVASIKQDHVQGRCSMMSMRRLNLLTSVSCQPAPRAALLHLLRAGRTDDDSPLSLLCWALSKGEPSGVAQTSVSRLLCGLCDPKVANLGSTPTPASRELLSGSVAALLNCVIEGSTKYGAKPLGETLSAANAVLGASEAALYHAKIILDGKDRGCFVPLLSACCTNAELLSSTLKFVHSSCDGESPIFLGKLVNWPLQEDAVQATPHPLTTLQSSSEAQDEISALVKSMEEVQAGDTPPVRDVEEPAMTIAEVLAAQFAQRPVTCTEDVPSFDICSLEVSSTPQQERLDLAELAAAALPDLNLAQELARLSHMHRAEETARHVKSEGVGRGDRGLRVRPYSNPMRGRGMYSIRGNVMAAPPVRGDTFRSRPPNTSRPPSLHVDDFLALESAGQQPTGPTGYNKQTMRAKEMLVSRPRIRSRGVVSERGIRFPSPNMVYRRDNSRGISRGLPPNLGRGVMSEGGAPWSGGIRPQGGGDKMLGWGGERGARRDMPRHPRTFTR